MLPALINRIELLKIDYEIIIVDDGSEKPVTISEYENDRCKLLTNKKNYGKGYAVKRGILHSSGDEIIFMDGDFPFNLSVIDIACKSIIQPGIDMIIGDRTLPTSSYARVPIIRFFGSKIISFIVSRFFTIGYYDTQCGIKGFNRAIALNIFSKVTINGFSFDVEVIFIALKRKYRIEKIP
ncbi:MAG: glycosyltransferase, partial [Ginsengibacter sp.]